MAEFEDDAGAAEVVKIGSKFRVHQGCAERTDCLGLGFVVIKDHEFATGLAELSSLGPGVGSAIDRDDKARHGFPQAPGDSLRAKAIAFNRAVGNETLDLGTGQPEVSAKDGERRNPIDIVVPVEGDSFPGGNRLQQTCRRFRYAWNLLGRAEGRETGIKKEGCHIGCGEPSGGEQRSHHVGDPEFHCEPPGQNRIGCVR
jgi:hypothetical protein